MADSHQAVEVLSAVASVGEGVEVVRAFDVAAVEE